jgi:dTDP-4-dehydrorhamnose 3,5-epimerase
MKTPNGFTHSFDVRSETAEFLYKITDYYAPAYDRCITWNETLNINWPISATPSLSVKDAQGLPLNQEEVFA